MRFLIFGFFYVAIFMAATQSTHGAPGGWIVGAVATALTMLTMGLLFGVFGHKVDS